jgi:hypothetical protein
VATHQKSFRQSQSPLQELIDQWDRNNCGNRIGNDLPANVRELADAPAPTPGISFRITGTEVKGALLIIGAVGIGVLTDGAGDAIFVGAT